MTFPDTLKISDLRVRHPEYAGREKREAEIRALYCGDEALEEHIGSLLFRRVKEPAAVYDQRKASLNYTNVLGAGIGWYLSKLFEQDPKIELPKAYADFLSDCDNAGTSFVDANRELAEDLLLSSVAYVLVDRPAEDPAKFPDRGAQREAGALREYIVRLCPESVTNWATDAYGNLQWVWTEQVIDAYDPDSAEFPPKPKRVREWRYYADTGEYAVYQAPAEPEAADEKAQKVGEGMHALADKGMVPVIRYKIPKGIWIGKRAFYPCRMLLNQENAYDWALRQNALAILWTKGMQEQANQTVSEIAHLALPANGEIGYLEQGGTTLQLIADRVDSLREEAYRGMYLVQQGRSASATPAAQSGVSKELDMMPGNEVLGGLGDAMRAGMVRVLEAVVAARGASDEPKVEGFDFQTASVPDELSVIEQLQRIDVPSDRFHKILYTRAALIAMNDQLQADKDEVVAEIEAAPTRTQLLAQQRADVEAGLARATESAFGA